MLGRLPISSCGSKAACFSLTRLEGQYHQKHLLELGVWGLEVVLVLPMAPIPPPRAGFFGPAPHVFLPQLCFCQVLSIRGERAPLPALAQVPGPLRQPALSVLTGTPSSTPSLRFPGLTGGEEVVVLSRVAALGLLMMGLPALVSLALWALLQGVAGCPAHGQEQVPHEKLLALSHTV